MKVAYPIACTHLRITSVLPGAGEGRVWIAQASGVVRKLILPQTLESEAGGPKPTVSDSYSLVV
ncbi:MAG: hypothetical protein ACLTT1_02890 [[Clostridium] scindens]